jgi:hypothetical protein
MGRDAAKADNSEVGGDKRVYVDLMLLSLLQTLDQRQLRATELWVGEARVQLCRAVPFAIWHRCRRLCPNNSAGPLRLFTDRNPAGF